jgi:hypothetical protein
MFRLDQKGVSLPLVLAILGLVIANTYYFMDVEKSTKEQNYKRSAELEDNSEKLRLASFLADVEVCSSTNTTPPIPPPGSGNFAFGGRTITEINDTAGSVLPLKKKDIIFLQPATATGPASAPNYKPLYGRNSLRFLKYQIVLTNPALPATDSKNYTLMVTYTIMDRLTQVIPTNKTKIIRLPLYIVFELGNPVGKIMTCYTEADESLGTVKATVDNTCFGDAATQGTNALNGLIECQHNIVNQECLKSRVLVGVTTDAQHQEVFTCETPQNKANSSAKCTQAPMREFLSDIKINDEFICRTTDTGCPDGQMFVMGPGAAPVCVSYCPLNTLFKGVGVSGSPDCIPRPEQCPTGEYTKEITTDGKVKCKPYTYLNKSCDPGWIATDLDIAAGESATATAAFHCRLITKTKVCPEPTTITTFVSSLATATPTCETY